MKFKKWGDKKVKKMDFYDVALIKINGFAFILLLAVFFPVITSLDWKWYALFFVLTAIRPFKRIFLGKK